MAEYISTTELAKLLGISRVAVFKRIKKGDIKAAKVGGVFLIDKSDVRELLERSLSAREKRDIESAVEKTAKEYGETLRLLGRE